MTTVVYADGVLATDSQATVHGYRNPAAFQKIYTPAEGKRWSIYGKRILAIGIAGEAEGLYELLSHLEKGIMFETKGKQDAWVSCIAVADDKSAFVLNNFGDRKHSVFWNYPLNSKISIGSGSDAANAYLNIGKKAVDVLKLVAKIDVNTGGDIQTWEFPEVVPEDVKPAEQTKEQKDLIDKVAADLDKIRASALEHATAEIIKQTTPAETEAKAKKVKA